SSRPERGFYLRRKSRSSSVGVMDQAFTFALTPALTFFRSDSDSSICPFLPDFTSASGLVGFFVFLGMVSPCGTQTFYPCHWGYRDTEDGRARIGSVPALPLSRRRHAPDNLRANAAGGSR